MEASARKSRTKQIIIHASIYQDDLDRLLWLSSSLGEPKSKVVRDAITMYFGDVRLRGRSDGED